MEHYKAMLPYKDMIVGIGLDSLEDDRPPSMFKDVYALAHAAGFRITAHCDVSNKDTLKNIREVASDLGGVGAHRIDHGLNAAERPELMELIKLKGIGMTCTPWGYLRHEPVDEIFPRIRALYDAGIPIAIGSDDPAYMEDTWILHDWLLVKKMCAFSDRDMITLARHAVDMSWASESVRTEIRAEIGNVAAKHSVSLL